MDNNTAAGIIAILGEFNAHFKELSSFLTEKQNKVLADDLLWLHDALTEEQKLAMKSSSLETKRLAFMNNEGLKGHTSSMLLDECPEEYKGRLRLEIVNMEKYIDHIKKLNSDTLETIEKKLTAAENFLRAKGGASADVYGGKGGKIGKIRLNDPESDIIGSI